MCAGIDFTSGDTGILSKKAFKFNKTLLCVLILAATLLLAGCGGAKSTRAKADETVHTALFDFTCGQASTLDEFGSLEIPEGNKLVQFHMTVTNTSDETYEIFKDDFQMQWGDGDDDFGLIGQLQKHFQLTVWCEARQNAGSMVVVKQLTAELQVQLVSELADPLADVFGLHR